MNLQLSGFLRGGREMKLFTNICAVFLLAALVALFGYDANAQSGDLKKWPAGQSPRPSNNPVVKM